MPDEPDPAVAREAEAALRQLEEEHRTIERRLRADRGMAAETRRLLLDHLREEEDERRAEVASLRARRDDGGAPRPPARLTVGSLRRDPPAPLPAPGRRGSVGSLRPER